MNHTPTPWNIEQGQGYHLGHWVITAEGMPAHTPVAHVQQTCGPEEAYPDAIFIITACNAHEELVTTLKGCLSWLSSYPGGGAMTQYDKVRKLLATIEKGA